MNEWQRVCELITERKITECWLVNEEGYFFYNLLCEEGKITQLVLRLPSNSLFNQEVVFLYQWRLVSRYVADEEYIEELKDKSEKKNKKNSTEWWKNVFNKWAKESNWQANLEE